MLKLFLSLIMIASSSPAIADSSGDSSATCKFNGERIDATYHAATGRVTYSMTTKMDRKTGIPGAKFQTVSAAKMKDDEIIQYISTEHKIDLKNIKRVDAYTLRQDDDGGTTIIDFISTGGKSVFTCMVMGMAGILPCSR